MASRLQYNEVVQQINDDSDWYNSDDDLIGDEQDGDLENFSMNKDPLDRVDCEEEEEESCPSPSPPTPSLTARTVPQASILETSNSSTSDPQQEASPVPSVNTSSQSVSSSFVPVPGPKVGIEPDGHPYDFFCQIWWPDTFKDIAAQTNLYASQKGTTTWTNVSEEEMQSFLGIHLAMGLVRLPSLRDYWTNPLLGAPGMVKGMGRNRFCSILSHLHLNDNSKMPQRGSPNFDKLFKIGPLLDGIRENSQVCYRPHQHLSIDEAMVLFKGRSSLRQYMPNKPIKWGYKCWCICDATNGYMYNVDVYTGASGNLDEDGLGATVVQKLLQDLYNANYHVYMDNFFSSVQLAIKLKEKGTLMIGTTRTNRKGWPKDMKNMKKMNKEMQRGESQSEVVIGIECVVWKDRKAVAIVNGLVDPSKTSHILRRNKDGTRSQVSCAESVRLYNCFMGGVDLFDSWRKTYSCSCKSKKWWLRLFYFLMDASVTNAYILYKETPQTKALTLKEFVLQLSEYLIGCNNSRKRSSAQEPPPASRLCGRHFPDRMSTQHQCKVCTQRRRTVFCCKDCSPEQPNPLCPTECFRIYHTKLNISRK